MDARSAATILPRPGPVHGNYPQRPGQRTSIWMDVADRLGDKLSLRALKERGGRHRFLRCLDAALAAPHDGRHGDMAGSAELASGLLMRNGFSVEAVASAQMAVASAICAELGHAPYRTQHIAAY